MSSLNIIFANNRVGVNELCLINASGDFVGVETGKIYSRLSHYKPDSFLARVIKVDMDQDNGMIHLEPNSDHHIKKFNYIGCIMNFIVAHYYGEDKIYLSIETSEYFSEKELEIIC